MTYINNTCQWWIDFTLLFRLHQVPDIRIVGCSGVWGLRHPPLYPQKLVRGRNRQVFSQGMCPHYDGSIHIGTVYSVKCCVLYPIMSFAAWNNFSALQHMIRLLNVLSAFPAVYEVLATKPLPSKAEYGFREIPTTIVVSKTTNTYAVV